MKTVKYFIATAIFAFSCTMPTQAMKRDNPDSGFDAQFEQKEKIAKTENTAEQPDTTEITCVGLDSVLSEIERIKPNKVILIIGVRYGEELFEKRFGHLLGDQKELFSIFADINPPLQDELGHCLTGNFSTLDVVQKAATALHNKLDIVATDGIGTTKFLNYSTDHLQAFYNALKIGGLIIYHRDIEIKLTNSPAIIGELALTAEEVVNFKSTLVEKHAFSFASPCHFHFPLNIAYPIHLDSKSIKEKTQTVLGLIQNYTQTDFLKIANALTELGLGSISIFQGRNLRTTDPVAIEEIIARLLQIDSFEKEKHLEYITITVGLMTEDLEKHFANVNVEFQDDDQEGLALVQPKDSDKKNYVVCKIRKQ